MLSMMNIHGSDEGPSVYQFDIAREEEQGEMIRVAAAAMINYDRAQLVNPKNDLET